MANNIRDIVSVATLPTTVMCYFYRDGLADFDDDSSDDSCMLVKVEQSGMCRCVQDNAFVNQIPQYPLFGVYRGDSRGFDIQT